MRMTQVQSAIASLATVTMTGDKLKPGMVVITPGTHIYIVNVAPIEEREGRATIVSGITDSLQKTLYLSSAQTYQVTELPKDKVLEVVRNYRRPAITSGMVTTATGNLTMAETSTPVDPVTVDEQVPELPVQPAPVSTDSLSAIAAAKENQATTVGSLLKDAVNKAKQ